MKKLFIIGLFSFSLMSCTLTSYMSNELSSNYQLKMNSKKEKALVDKIPIYLSENEVQREFTVVSINTYHPIVLPVIGNRKKVVLEGLYKKAVKTAEDQKGNAVIIIGDSHFKVIIVK